MEASIKVICPECSAEFEHCDKHGSPDFEDREEFMICPEPFDCELSGVVYKQPDPIKLEKL